MSDEVIEPFAKYLAQVYLGKGYKLGCLPEMKPLALASDISLVRSDGMTVNMVFVIDRETHPDKFFDISQKSVDELGQSCLKYTARVQHVPLPVYIMLVEVRGKEINELDLKRLEPITCKPSSSKVKISTWYLDTEKRNLWTNANWKLGWGNKRLFSSLLISPRKTAEELRAPSVRPHKTPWLTWAMIAILTVGFVVETVFPVSPSADCWLQAFAR